MGKKIGFVGLGLGATTTVASGEGLSALWLSIAGVGTGLTMATAASAGVAELDEEQAGVGSAVLQALKNTGAPLGSALLGSTMLAAYVVRLHLTGLPAAAATTVRQGVFQGAAVAISSTRRRCWPRCAPPSCTGWTPPPSSRSPSLPPAVFSPSSSFPWGRWRVVWVKIGERMPHWNQSGCSCAIAVREVVPADTLSPPARLPRDRAGTGQRRSSP